MALILAPSALAKRAELYYQLGNLLNSGIGILPALEHIRRNPPARSFRKPLEVLAQHIDQGSSFGEALRAPGPWLPSFDVALLEASAESGRLPDVLRLLSKHYGERAQLLRSFLGFIAYPTFILHFAILIFPLRMLQELVLQGNVSGYILQKLLVLAPLYGVVFIGIIALQGSWGEAWRSLIERLLHWIPVLGTARRNFALARLAAALEALVSAGVLIIPAWELAANASGSPALRRAVQIGKPRWCAGEPPSVFLAVRREFPPIFSQLYHTGEISGRLDESLARLYDLYQDEGRRKLKAFALGVAGLIMLAIVLGVAWQVIAFYAAYFRQIGGLMD